MVSFSKTKEMEKATRKKIQFKCQTYGGSKKKTYIYALEYN